MREGVRGKEGGGGKERMREMRRLGGREKDNERWERGREGREGRRKREEGGEGGKKGGSWEGVK